jgi:hypothetical protein
MAKIDLTFMRRVEFDLPQGIVIEEKKSRPGVTMGNVPFVPRIPDWMNGGLVEVMRGRLCAYIIEERQWEWQRLFSYMGVGAMPFAYLSEEELLKLADKYKWGGYDRALRT